MNGFVNTLKCFLKNIFVEYSTPQEVETQRDYRYVQQWVKKVSVLYTVFTLFAVFTIPVAWFILISFDVPPYLCIVPFPLVLFTNWGYATLVIYLRKIVKSLLSSAKNGYSIGKNFETTTVSVTHEFANTYRVSSNTTNKGLLFGYIGVVIQFFIWAFFCVYIGPFLTFKKIKKSKENLKRYKKTHA